MSPWISGPLAFGITFAESWVSSRERAAERKSRTYRTAKFSAISATWAMAFEMILLADIVLTVAEPWAITPWVLLGAWLGQFKATEKDRRKFRRNAGNVANLRKSTKSRKISASPDHGGTIAAPGVAANAPEAIT
jgi:hypothetical protein